MSESEWFLSSKAILEEYKLRVQGESKDDLVKELNLLVKEIKNHHPDAIQLEAIRILLNELMERLNK